MALTPTPNSLGAPTMGLSDVFQRNTESDTPSQQAGFAGVDQVKLVPNQWNSQNLADFSHYPISSGSWQQWFEGGASQNWATGRPQMFMSNPDPTGIVTAIQSGRGAMYPGHTWIKDFSGNYSMPHWTATGKIQQPYAPS